MPFRDLGLDAKILKSLQAAGYTKPTPIQSAAIPLILAGHDLIGIAQTGTGKTAAFVWSILAKPGRLTRAGGAPSWHGPAPNPASGQTRHGEARRNIRPLIVAPTRELVAQIEESIRAYGRHLPLRAATVSGGVSERPQVGPD